MLNEAHTILKTVFGYDQFRGHQQAAIEHLIAGQDALVLMPTGGGKSLCYQIPALVRPGVGIVISPLIALMQDQVNALLQLGVRAAFLNSTLSQEQSRRIEQQLISGEIDLLYIAPERLTNAYTLALFERIQIALFAIDEAHCVSQWGHDFRVDYLQLSMLHERFPSIPRIALTATADDKTREEIKLRLSLTHARLFLSSFDRPNIRYAIVQKREARQQLMHFIHTEHQGDSGIVYCLSRKKVEETAAWLTANGVRALPYHAGMEAPLRAKHQHEFLMNDNLIMVATIAFGMGIDKPNVRFVAHLDLPKSLEAYYQETGRAGRDGLPANAWMTYGLQDVITLRRMLAQSTADEAHKRIEYHKLDAMLALCEQVVCRRQSLLRYFGDTLEQPCGNCDTCLQQVETWDGTVAAQKALSCIHRTGQRFGSHYLIDVLLGKASERMVKAGHDKLSTFGIGKDLAEQQWHSVFRQLVARGLVAVDFDNFNVLRLSDACRPILRGEQTLMLRKDQPVEAKHKTKHSGQHFNKHNALWDALREKRREIADKQGVPAYVIFHDATLMAMMEARPTSLQDMAKISGIGVHKLELYGTTFLAVLNQFKDAIIPKMLVNTSLSDTARDSYALFKAGLSVERVAKQRDLKESTVYGHLAQALAHGQLVLTDVLDLPEAEIKSIQDALISLSEEDRIGVKPLFEMLEGQYSYEVLRCVKSAWDFQSR
ncbi:DNA helicase RecQ [Crenothrix polyspora]|uniref:DNA helicase RecQ n=1 Tax=Crenothrix polyspora TaxID=360316 RepID=A0A1R4H805_9GAMM|nr:DNA helicase RecQ [Crenothrix polyspora]SJM92395.1 ATP-dependent DNA helicase RecQ [Crenothrix polyspora]